MVIPLQNLFKKDCSASHLYSHKAEGSISEVGILTFASMFKADSDSQALFNKSTIYVSVSQQDGNIKNHVAHRTLTLCAKTN